MMPRSGARLLSEAAGELASAPVGAYDAGAMPRTSLPKKALVAIVLTAALCGGAACNGARPAPDIQGSAATVSPTSQASAPTSQASTPTSQASNMSFHDFTANTIEGKPQALSEYKGKVLLVVNTASECGYTPQYAGLERLHEKLQGRGFAVLGFPSNDFGAQEPGSDKEIAQFCDAKFHVTFPMFSKSVVKGSGKTPLYAFLTQAPFSDDGGPPGKPGSAPKPPGEVKWNFEKFLIGKDGKVAGRYPSSVEPEDAKLAADIEAALAR
jgi:glutathione peroxidase